MLLTDRQTGRTTDRQNDRQAERQTGRTTDRQSTADKQTDIFPMCTYHNIQIILTGHISVATLKSK